MVIVDGGREYPTARSPDKTRSAHYYGGVLDLARVISCAEPARTGGVWGGRDINGWAAVLAGGLGWPGEERH